MQLPEQGESRSATDSVFRCILHIRHILGSASYLALPVLGFFFISFHFYFTELSPTLVNFFLLHSSNKITLKFSSKR